MTPSPSQLIVYGVRRLECEVHEARLRIQRGRPAGVRIVVQCPDEETWWLLGALVEALGGVLERNPAALALGIPLPGGKVLTFVMPEDPSTPGLLALG